MIQKFGPKRDPTFNLVVDSPHTHKGTVKG